MNSAFASYATGVAFRLDLSKRMVDCLIRASRGSDVDTGHYGAPGLVRRGLLEPAEQPTRMYQKLKLTDAGCRVFELCKIAGLVEIVEKPLADDTEGPF